MIVAEQIQTALDGAQHRLIATQAATGTTPKEMAERDEKTCRVDDPCARWLHMPYG